MTWMRKQKNQRLLTAAVGFVFLFSTVFAQAPFCFCAVTCESPGQETAKKTGPDLSTEGHACCAPESQDDAPDAPAPAHAAAHQSDCTCPVKAREGDPDASYAPVAAFTQSIHHAPETIAPPDTSPVLPNIALEDGPRWRPVRGGPLASTSLHVLHSTFII